MTLVRVPDTAREFSPRVNFQCRLSYGVRTAAVCRRLHQHLCAYKKCQALAAILLFEHTNILDTLTEKGSAALAVAVPYPVRRPELPTRDNEVLKYYI